MLHIQQRNNWTYFVPLLLLVISVVRVPVADGFFRPLFRLVAETGVYFLLVAIVFRYANKWVGLFLALALFSAIYPNFGKWSYMARDAVLMGCLWYVMLVVVMDGNVGPLMNAICIVGIANVLFATFQHTGFDPYSTFTLGLMKTRISGDPTGLMANKNLLSALLAFTLPAFYRRGWALLVPFVFYGLTIAASSGGVVAATVMTVVYFFLKDGRDALRKNFFLVSALVIWLCFFINVVDHPVTIEVENQEGRTVITHGQEARTGTWKKGLHLYRQRPLAGFGIGHWKLVFKKMAKPGASVMIQAHNEYIQGLFEMGILFPVLLLGYFVSIVLRYRRRAILSATAVGIVAINCLVNFPFHVATTALLAVTWMAILEIELRKSNGLLEVRLREA